MSSEDMNVAKSKSDDDLSWWILAAGALAGAGTAIALLEASKPRAASCPQCRCQVSWGVSPCPHCRVGLTWPDVRQNAG